METFDPRALPALDSLDLYRQHLADAGFWAPYAQAICRRHVGVHGERVRSGLVGTYPTMIVDERWVVKLFGRHFDGGGGFAAEREAVRLVAPALGVPIPTLVASGQLLPGSADWPWPYLVYDFIPGVSIGEVYSVVSWNDKLALARDLGHMTRRLHGIVPAHSTVFKPSWDAYAAFFRQRRNRCVEVNRAWGTLPEHLVAQLDGFLLPAEALYDPSSPPHLIHADITRDHILGGWEDGRWVTRAIIDWGDVGVGTLEYELVALHLDLFACDKELLAVYLDAYGLDERSRQGLPRRAMSTALLHAWNTLVGVFGPFPQARQVATLEELTALVWEIGAPGLEK